MLFRHSKNGSLGPGIAFNLNVAPWAFATHVRSACEWLGSLVDGFRAHWEIPDIRFRGLSIIKRDNKGSRRSRQPGNLSILLETQLAMSSRSRFV